MYKGRTAVIIVNTGTPHSPKVRDVRRYLREFLGDGKVINMPWLFRKMLVNFIIAPIRGPRSAKLYQSIWTSEGSPLLVNSLKFSKALQYELGDDFKVITAMRYGSPSMDEAVEEAAKETYSRIILFPLYPQYADSTTGTIVAEFKRLVRKHKIKKEFKVIPPFFRNDGFIKAFSQKILSLSPSQYDHILFSFHGLPVKQTEKMHPGKTCEEANCANEYNSKNKNCYYASCHETARLLAQELSLGKNQYTVTFQSRLGMNWLKPYTDEVIKEMALKGLRKLLIASPAFVADCLETIQELGVEYKELFIDHGGKELTLVESLNDDDNWIQTAAKLIRAI
ncbi:MAG TPA: ferrochelatase [Bacteroidales bacterium]|nr:ferrochelatase [Bacteroidales bacterium]HLN53621.1 ferrochelatase [Lentimicrobium sp.]